MIRMEIRQLLLTEKDVARIVNLSLPTLRRWRAAGEGPLFVKIGSAVRYRDQDVAQWLADLSPVSGQEKAA